jgi:hypothetical protein
MSARAPTAVFFLCLENKAEIVRFLLFVHLNNVE